MTNAALRQVINLGFPFTIHISDGRVWKVPGKEYIWLPPRVSVTYVAMASEEFPNEVIARQLPLSMITSVSIERP